ncbi:MAG: S41 family peptidase [Phycisphaerae bacterium]
MKTTCKILFVLFLMPVIVSAMSMPANEPQQQTQSSEISCAEQAVNAICGGNFDSAEEIIKKCNAKDANTAEIKGVVAAYRGIEADRDKAKRQAFKEQKAELAKLQARPESNEPNLLEILPVIIKAKEFASEQEKKQLLEDKFVQKTIAKARKVGDDYEAKGQWLNALLYSYSWLDAIYEGDKEIAEKKKSLEAKANISAITETKKAIEERAIIRAALDDNPCETYADRYQKITPKMFIRGLDVLEYGYVEPVSYSGMAEKVFKRFEYLAEVLKYSDPCDSNFTMSYLPDKLSDFSAGLGLLKNNYAAEPVIMTRDQFVKLFGQVLSLNSLTIKLPDGVVISHFAESALSSLDPHTIFIWPKQVEDFDKSMTNEFSGIGVEISKADGLLKAVSLLPGPAYDSGLVDAGDIIEKVNGENTKEMSVTCAVSKITGPAGTKVKLTIRKPDSKNTFEVELARAKIIVPTIRGWGRNETGDWQYFVDDQSKVGYVRVSQFSATTAGDLDRILKSLEAQDMNALILDLRYNTGGFLQSAAEISDMFLDKGVIVSSQPRVGLPTWEAAHKKDTHPNYPVVILINGGSASASEIVAGALSDKTYSRAVLVGEQSYGKGSVQTVTEYTGEGSQLKYTMAYYHLPDGRRVKDRWAAEKTGSKDWGIMPNMKVELRTDELKKLFDIQRDNDVLAAADHDNNKAKLVRHNLTETLEADRQLAVAILIAKAKLIEAGLK